MRLPSARGSGLMGVMAVLLVTTGCYSTSINFEGPPKSVMFVEGKPHHLPASIELARPGGTSGKTRHDVSLVSTVGSQELRAKGHIDVFAYEESDVDKMAVNTCVMDEGHLSNLLEGNIVVFTGQSASRQPLYELTLSRESASGKSGD